MKAVLVLAAVFTAVFFSCKKVEGANLTSTSSGYSEGIKLTESGIVEISTQLGQLSCTNGKVFLESPKLRFPKEADPKIKLIEVYGEKSQREGSIVVNRIGPYPAGTELVFAIEPLTKMCSGQHLVSTDLLHARIVKLGENNWKIIWEDLKDRDFNDLYTFVEIVPQTNTIFADVKAKQAFNSDPHYQLPWKPGESRKVSQVPGEGTHWDADAYDFSGKFDVYAPEMGLVLWVEDSFGIGGDNPNLNSRVNVIVLQTSPDTQITLVHLATNSVHSLGINIGDVVQKGQLIGKTDLTGYATGVHLHFEFQTACHTPPQNLATWTLIVSGKRSRTHLDWSCSTKSFYSDGFWSGGIFYPKLIALKSYQNNP